MSQQIISLMVLSSFSYANSSLYSIGASNYYNVLSNSLSSWLSQISKDFDIGVRYTPEDNMTAEELEVALSTQLFDDRLTIEGNVGMYNGLRNEVAAGTNKWRQCDVSGWTDLVAVGAGIYHTVGLRLDGTVVAVGDNRYGQCDVSEWTNIVAIDAGDVYTAGVKADGTVVIAGSNDYGQYDVSGWTDIVAVSVDSGHIVGLKADGTVVAAGDNGYGQCNVSGWKDIVAISTGYWHTVGLKSNGTVVAVGDNWFGGCNVYGWRDIRVPE